MKNLKILQQLIVLVLCLGIIFYSSCEKESNDPDESALTHEINVQDETEIALQPKKKCQDKVTSKICECGKTPDEAKLKLAAKARIYCAGLCLGQDCDKKKTCNLAKVKQKTNASIKEKEDPENPDGPMLFEACATFKCKCKCVNCGGKKQVAKEESATAPDKATATAIATQNAKAWCADFGCPAYQSSCKNPKKCKSTGAGIVKKISEEQVPGPVPNVPHWKVTVILTECSCRCS